MLAAVSAHQRRVSDAAPALSARRDARARRPCDGDARPRRQARIARRQHSRHGDQKLLDIALALVLEPKVLLLDEPTAGMGPEERWQMIEKVRQLWERRRSRWSSSSTTWTSCSRSRPRSACCATAACWPRERPTRSARNQAVIEAYLGTEHPRGPRHERAHHRSRRDRRLLRHEPDPVRRRPRGAEGRDDGAARPQRRGQEHDDEGDHGPGAAARAARSACAAATISGPEAAPDRARRPRLRARGPAGLSRAHASRTISSSARRRGRTGSDEWTSKRIYECFRCWSRCATAWRAACRAASSRCSPSRAR